jgi:hypothetical protein
MFESFKPRPKSPPPREDDARSLMGATPTLTRTSTPTSARIVIASEINESKARDATTAPGVGTAAPESPE